MNRMKPLTLCCVFIALIFISCRNNVGKSYAMKYGYLNSEKSKTQKNSPQVDLYADFLRNKDLIVNKLSVLSNEEGNGLCEKYYHENLERLLRINEFEHFSLAKYYNEDIDSKNVITALKEKLDHYGLMIKELGEGSVKITTAPGFYYDIFADNVTRDVWKYMAIRSEENKVPCRADAVLLVSFNELAHRIMKRERFMRRFPHSIMFHHVKQEYKELQLLYLLGVDNTPTIDRFNPDSIYVYYDNKMEYERFSAKHPNSSTTKLIQFFFQNFKKENLRELLMEAQENS